MQAGRDVQYVGWDSARWLARLDRGWAAGQNKASPRLPECVVGR
jgi:hypothetical protein